MGDKATIHYNCARAAMRLGRQLQGVTHCSAAIEMDESFFKAWKLRGECHQKLYNFEQAVKDLQQAVELSAADEKLLADLEEAQRSRDMDHYTLFGVQVDA